MAAQQTCVLCASGSDGLQALLVRLRSHELKLDCLVPRWSDMAYHLEQDPRVVVIVPAGCMDRSCSSTPNAAFGVAFERPMHKPMNPQQDRPVNGLFWGLCWLHCRGHAYQAQQPDWDAWFPTGTPQGIAPQSLYFVFRVTPNRLEFMDENRGWGSRETLDL